MYARLTDGKNYGGMASGNVTNIDKEKPEITAISTTTNSVVINATDNLSGINAYAIKTENTEPSASEWNKIDITKSFNKTEIGLKQNATYYVWLKDQAGNISEVSSKQTGEIPGLVKDSTVKFAQNPSDWTNKDVTVTASTTITGYTLQTSKDGKTWESKTSQTFSANGTMYARLTDGKNYGGMASGNVTNIDKEKPEITAISTTTNSVVINATDNLSGINAYAIKTTNSTPTGNEWETAATTTSFSKTVEKLTQNQTYYVWVKDQAGNISEVASKSTESVPGLIKDSTVTFKSVPSGWTNGNVVVTASTTVKGYTLQTKVKDGEWESVSSQEFAANGEMQARLFDGTNYGGAATFNVTIIDKVAPTISKLETTTKSVAITATDNLSGINAYAIKTTNSTPTGNEWETATATTSFTQTIDNLKQNTTYYVWVKDQAGNVSEVATKATTGIPGLETDKDNPTKPTVTFTSSPTGWTSESVTVTAATTITGYTLQTSVDNKTWESKASQTFSKNGTMYARLTDGKNYGGTASFGVTNIDLTTPTITNVTSTTKSITITATDVGSGIDGYVVKTSNSTPALGDFTPVTATNSFSRTVDNLAQNTTYYIWVKDQVGHISEMSTKATTGIPGLETDKDNPTKPTVTFTSSPTGWTSGSVTVTAATTITGYTLQTSVDNKTWESKASQTFSKNGTMYARLTDGKNYGGTASFGVTNIDLTTPTITNVTSTTKSITITATDVGSGIDGYVVKTSNSTPAVGDFTPVTATNSFSRTVDNLAQNTTYYIWVKDQVGHISAMSTKATTGIPGLETDKDNPTKPTVTFTSSPTGWTRESVTVTAATTITGYTLQTSVDNKTWESKASQTFSKNETMYARLTDGKNYGGTASFGVTNIDLTTPTITNVTSTTKSIAITATDVGSGIDGYVVKTSNSTPAASEFTPVTATNSFSRTVDNLAQNTTYYIWVKDQVGHISEMSTKATTGIPGLETDKDNPTKPTVTFTSSPTDWTSESVTVTAATTITGYTLQTSVDNKKWESKASQTFSKNGTMYARLTDGKNYGGTASFGVTNIDLTTPTITNVTSTTKSITITATDVGSGIDGYVVKTSNSTPAVGDFTPVTATNSFSRTVDNLAQNTTYYIWVKDQVGHISAMSTKATTGIPGLETDKDNPTKPTVTFTSSPTGWTSGSVTVTASTTETGYTLQTSKDGETWSNSATQTFTENGTMYVRLTDGKNYGGMATASVTNIVTDRSGIKVGDYVNYTPDSASAYSSSKLSSSITGLSSNSSDLTQDSLTWQVLRKYDDGTIDLIGSPTSKDVYFTDALGYNNGVYVMNDICESLYSKKSKGITARSVNLEDMEKWLTADGIKAREKYSNEVAYGKTKTYTGSNSYKPDIYGKIENESDKYYSTPTTNTYSGGNSSDTLEAKQTYYKISINSTNYGDGAKALTASNTYWVASRFVNCYSDLAIFGLRIASSYIGGNDMFYSNIYNIVSNYRLRPVVSLGSNIQITPCTGTNSPSNMHTINWPKYGIKFTYSTSEKTTESVTVTAEDISKTGYTLQTSKDGKTWSNTASQTFTENGTMYARLTDGTRYYGMATASVTNIVRSGIKVGDYINYKPDNAEAYSKSKLAESITGSSSNSADLTQDSLTWQVLRIYDDGSMDLIGSRTNKNVCFKGALGYNNGVYVMNDICESLYSKKSKGITARSVNLEDMEKWLTTDGIKARGNYSNAVAYGQTKTYTGSKSYKPDIYGKTTNESDKYYNTPTTNTYTGGSSSDTLEAKQTYYDIDINSTNYGDGAKVLTASKYYWVASRYVGCNSSYASFGLRAATNYIIGYSMLYSNISSNYAVNRLRPVVSLGSNIQITPSSGTNGSNNMHTINWN